MRKCEHLNRYVREFTGRHNVRPMNTVDQMAWMVRRMDGKVLRYKDWVPEGYMPLRWEWISWVLCGNRYLKRSSIISPTPMPTTAGRSAGRLRSSKLHLKDY